MSDLALHRLDLLARQVTEGLEPPERAELDDLLCAESSPGVATFERAAAAIELAYLRPEPMPEAARDRVAARLRAAMASETASNGEASTATSTRPSSARILSFPEPDVDEPSSPERYSSERRALERRVSAHAGSLVWGGWLVAAAALLLAVLGWLWPRGNGLVLDPTPPTVAELREILLQSAPDALALEWQATEDPAARTARGDVVWSGNRQRGFMRIAGLETNDPERFQYQLWIFDAARDDRYPVDGGVFDVTGDEVVIPIDSKIAVESPTLFAVTVEPPGGVVVSDRERIVLLAQAG